MVCLGKRKFSSASRWRILQWPGSPTWWGRLRVAGAAAAREWRGGVLFREECDLPDRETRSQFRASFHEVARLTERGRAIRWNWRVPERAKPGRQFIRRKIPERHIRGEESEVGLSMSRSSREPGDSGEKSEEGRPLHLPARVRKIGTARQVTSPPSTHFHPVLRPSGRAAWGINRFSGVRGCGSGPARIPGYPVPPGRRRRR